MKQSNFHKSFLLILVIALLSAALCPYVCQAANTHAQAHACCPESMSSKAPADSSSNSEPEKCCDDIELNVLKIDSADDVLHFEAVAVVGFIQEELKSLFVSNQAAVQLSAGVPIYPSGVPVYLFKQSFLI